MKIAVRRPLRHSDAMLFLESFLIGAVVSILVVRWSLSVTGFPRLGKGELHIAHLLWGGGLMLLALLLLMVYLDRAVQHRAAVIAGLGFGMFIDEVGKFVTADNDYFFRPAVAMIDVILVALFLLGRSLVGSRVLTQREALANAMDLLETHIDLPIEPDDRTQIRELLDRAGDAPLAMSLGRYLDGLPERPDVEAWWERVPSWFATTYREIAADPRFNHVLSAVVIVYAAAAVTSSLLLIVAARQAGTPLDPASVGQILSTLTGAGLIGIGVLALPTSRTEAYRWFIRGILVWLLVTQVFIFYGSQLAGLAGLAVDLAAYLALRYALGHEARADRGSPQVDPVAEQDRRRRA